MGMQLTQDQLTRLADALPLLDGTGVSVRQIEFAGHDVFLNVDENGSHSVRGISKQKDAANTSQPVMCSDASGRTVYSR